MTVTAATRRAGPYAGNGVNTSFPFSFKVFAATDVQPVLTDSTGAATNLVLNSDFSVLLNADQDANPGGTVTYPILVGPVPLPAGSTLTIVGGMSVDQLTDITNAGRYLPQVIENALDKATILIQQLQEVSNRTLQAAIGTTVKLLFPAPSSGKFIRWRSDLLGLENAEAGTDSTILQGLLADAGLNTRGAGMIGFTSSLAYPPSTVGATLKTIADLPSLTDSAKGAALVGYKAAFTGGIGRSLAAKLGETLSIRDFGAIGDGLTHPLSGFYGSLAAAQAVYPFVTSLTQELDYAALQAAVNAADTTGKVVYLPAGIYRLNAQVNITKGIRITGDGASLYNPQPGQNAVGGGSWLHIDHAGVGLYVLQAGNFTSGVRFDNFGTRRTQPVPAPGWGPNVYDYDIVVDNSDVDISDFVLLNPTKGIRLINGNAGRMMINRLRGQPLGTGIRIEECFDVVHMNQVHFWPFWQLDTNVTNYTLVNANAFEFFRCDNPLLSNIFTLLYASGIYIAQGTTGTVSKMHLVNGDFDAGTYGIRVAATANGATGQFENITCEPKPLIANTYGIMIEGNNCFLDFGSVGLNNARNNAVRVQGTGNELRFSSLTVRGYDLGINNFPAVEVLNGNVVRFAQTPYIINGGGSGGRFAEATGSIYSPEWRSFAPSVIAASGAIGTFGAVTGRFMLHGNSCKVAVDIAIVTNGTGSSAINVQLPRPALFLATGAGRDIGVGGKLLSFNFNASTGGILNYDNTYPAANGSRLVATGEYPVS